MSEKPNTRQTSQELIIYRLDEIKLELVDIKRNYVTKTESSLLKQEISQLRADVSELKEATSQEIERIKNKNNLIAWLYPTASAAFSALVTYLLIEYFKGK